jgi:hypothetical protein
MADNVTLPLTGTGDATAAVATKEISSKQFQKMLLADPATGDPVPAVTVTAAHDAADASSSVGMGLRASTSLAGATPVAAGDRTAALATTDGRQITHPYCSPEDIVSGVASNTDGAATEVIAAAGAGIKTYLTSYSFANMSATPVYVEIKSDTTVMWRVVVPAGGGVVGTFPVPLPPSAADKAWNMDGSAAATTLYGSLCGFKSKV